MERGRRWPPLPSQLVFACCGRVYTCLTSCVLVCCGGGADHGLAAGYNAPDYQAGISLVDMGETLKLSYAHNIDARSTAGAEVQRKLNKDLTSFTLGYSRRLDNGAITKYRLDNTGAQPNRGLYLGGHVGCVWRLRFSAAPATLCSLAACRAGIASALYETNLESKTKVALSAAFNALNLQQAPKVGVALNMTN